MLHFRTILLWLAFIMLVLQYFVEIRSSITLGIIFRLLPSAILLFWFLLSLFFKVKLKIQVQSTPAWVITLLNILRPMASISIVIGALFKIMHWPFGNIMLIMGIAFMAVYSTILSRFAETGSSQNPDIIDDMNDQDL